MTDHDHDQHRCYTCIHKYYTTEEWKDFAKTNKEALEYLAAPSGIADGDFDRLKEILESIPEVSKPATLTTFNPGL